MTTIDDRFEYGESEHAFYEENGYFLFDHFLTDEAAAACRARVVGMIGRLHESVAPEMMIGVHQYERWIFDMAAEPKLLDVIERQIGPDILLWASHMLCKPPRTGEAVPWHQDAPYWNLSGRFGAGVWIALSDVDEDNGAMSVIPGWHQKGTLPIQESGVIKGFHSEIVPSALPDDVDERRIQYILKAGQMGMHDVMIPHNSPPNRSDRWRLVLVLRYIAADAQLGPNTYYHYETGEPFEREFFLVRGQDARGLGLRRSPFEASAT